MKVGHNVFYRLRSAGIKIMDEENKWRLRRGRVTSDHRIRLGARVPWHRTTSLNTDRKVSFVFVSYEVDPTQHSGIPALHRFFPLEVARHRRWETHLGLSQNRR